MDPWFNDELEVNSSYENVEPQEAFVSRQLDEKQEEMKAHEKPKKITQELNDSVVE